MWTKSHTIVTNEVTKEQMWQLFADVNSWYKWDTGLEYTKLEGKFEKGNFFELKPKGGPKFKVEIVETIENKKFSDCTKLPLAKMLMEHTFEETPQGLKITGIITVTGILGFLWRKIIAQGIADGLPKEMQAQIKYASKL